MKSVLTLAIAFCAIANTGINLNAQESSRLFYVKVNKSTELQGQIIEASDLEVETAFGNVTIPFDKIEAIKMRANDGSAVIAFINGDMVTGKIQIEELHLKTLWGKAHINAASIESISGSQYGSFYADPNGGWRYSRGSNLQSGGAQPARGFTRPTGTGAGNRSRGGFTNPGTLSVGGG